MVHLKFRFHNIVMVFVWSITEICGFKWFLLEQKSEGYIALSVLHRNDLWTSDVKNASEVCRQVMENDVFPWTGLRQPTQDLLCTVSNCLDEECDYGCAEDKCAINIGNVLSLLGRISGKHIVVDETFSWCSAFAVQLQTNQTFVVHHNCKAGLPETMYPFYNFLSCHPFLQFIILSSKILPSIYLEPPHFSAKFDDIGTGIVVLTTDMIRKDDTGIDISARCGSETLSSGFPPSTTIIIVFISTCIVFSY